MESSLICYPQYTVYELKAQWKKDRNYSLITWGHSCHNPCVCVCVCTELYHTVYMGCISLAV